MSADESSRGPVLAFRRLAAFVLVVLFAIKVGATPRVQKPAQLDDGLPTAEPAEVGCDQRQVAGLVKRLGSREYRAIDSMLLLKDGKLILEEYRNGYSREKRHDIASITKSVTSLLVGLAIDRGLLAGVDEEVRPFFRGTPHFDDWPEEKAGLTVRHLLTMQHGIAWDDYADPGMRRFNDWMRSDDRVGGVLEAPTDRPPGTKSVYCTASTQLLQQVLESSVGTTVSEFAREQLFEPLGVEGFAWESSPDGEVAMGYGADARPRDLAVLGLMLLQDGRWNDKQVVPSDWLSESFRPHGELLGIDYGYLWYGEPYEHQGKTIESRLAMGHGGQFLILLPSVRSVLVITASDYSSKIDFYSLISESVLPLVAP